MQPFYELESIREQKLIKNINQGEYTMKRIFTLLLAAVMLVAFTACGAPAKTEKPGDKLELSELMQTILKDVELPAVGDIEITKDNFNSFLFIDYIDGAQALASEGLINAVAHSVVLLRVPDGVDAAKTAADIEKNADPRKWICVEAEKTIVKQYNNTILLVMSFADTTDQIAKNFDSLYA